MTDDLLFYPESSEFNSRSLDSLPAIHYYFAFGYHRCLIHQSRRTYLLLASFPCDTYNSSCRGMFIHGEYTQLSSAIQAYRKLCDKMFDLTVEEKPF